MAKHGGNPNWQKGCKSPNPSGRPAVDREFKERCREILESGGGIEQLQAMLEGVGQDRRFALEMLLAYGYGRPGQSVKVEGGEQPVKLFIDLVPAEKDDNGKG